MPEGGVIAGKLKLVVPTELQDYLVGAGGCARDGKRRTQNQRRD